MAKRSVLPFDGIEINGTGYGAGTANTCKFVAGSGSATANAEITRTVTECGTIIYRQLYKDFTFSCSLVGNYSALNTDAPDQDEIKVLHGGAGAAVLTIYGAVEAEFDDSTNETSITATGKIVTSPEPLLTATIVEGTSGEPSI